MAIKLDRNGNIEILKLRLKVDYENPFVTITLLLIQDNCTPLKHIFLTR